MTRTQISAWIMLVFCGLWSGGILIFAVERTNLWRRMPLEQYAVDFRRSRFRADPMMPILGLTAVAAATFFCPEPQRRRDSFCVGRDWLHRAGGGRVNHDRRADQLKISAAARRPGAGTG